MPDYGTGRNSAEVTRKQGRKSCGCRSGRPCRYANVTKRPPASDTHHLVETFHCIGSETPPRQPGDDAIDGFDSRGIANGSHVGDAVLKQSDMLENAT